MKSYDEIIGFDYTDENEWKGWIREKFIPLHNQLSVILKLRKHLEDILKTNLKEALNRESIKEILLGGITKDGEYAQNSLAKFYKDALGISINPKEWVAYCRAGLNPVENGIECKFEDTSFLAFITEMKELVEEVLSKIEIEPQDVEDREIDEIVNSPEKILEIIKEIYKSIVSISANHDYHMFFILNTHCIPRFFIEKAYPKLKENFKKVSEILELEEKFVPDINDEKVKRDYTLIGHKENGLADFLFQLSNKLWESLRIRRREWETENPIRKIFEKTGINVIDLEEIWLKKCEKIITISEYPRGTIAFYFVKNDDIYLEYYFRESSKYFIRKGSTTLIKLLTTIAPELFLNIRELFVQSEPDFQYEMNVVGRVRTFYLGS